MRGFLLGGLIAYGYEYFGKFRAALLMHAGVNYVVALCISFLISKELMQWKTTRFLIGEK